MKRFNLKITVILVLFITVATVVAVQFCKYLDDEEHLRTEITTIAKNYDLEDIEVSFSGKISEDDSYKITLYSEDFDNLTYKDMISLKNSLCKFYYTTYTFTSNNTYTISDYRNTIQKNGEVVYSDYQSASSTTNDKDKSVSKNTYSSSSSYYKPYTNSYSFTYNSTKDYTSSSASSSRYYSHYYTPKKSDDDPYNAKDYRNEEDFYDDHYYDFFDYYDAEDYYREHTD